jgi:release factor glutamine methyltransferase
MNVRKIRDHQEAFLDKAKARKIPLTYTINDITIIVNPSVFPPATDTKLLVENIHAKVGERILDLTTGSGLFAIKAGLQGATGLAIDINPAAVNNANQNFKKYNVQMKAIEGNLFEKVPDEQFDQIFANGPFFEGEINDPLDYACYGAQSFIKNLLLGIRKYLKKKGKLLIVMSSWSDLKYFQGEVRSNKLIATLIATKNSDDNERSYNLYKVESL